MTNNSNEENKDTNRSGGLPPEPEPPKTISVMESFEREVISKDNKSKKEP